MRNENFIVGEGCEKMGFSIEISGNRASKLYRVRRRVRGVGEKPAAVMLSPYLTRVFILLGEDAGYGKSRRRIGAVQVCDRRRRIVTPPAAFCSCLSSSILSLTIITTHRRQNNTATAITSSSLLGPNLSRHRHHSHSSALRSSPHHACHCR